jgi:hypothetical protein
MECTETFDAIVLNTRHEAVTSFSVLLTRAGPISAQLAKCDHDEWKHTFKEADDFKLSF